VISGCTKTGIQPHFVFDAEKDSEGAYVIPGWARKAFEGSHLNLVFPFLTRGIEIPYPEFVNPASKPFLEVADFVSFVVARYCYRRIMGQPIDLDPKHLGPVSHIGFDPSGDVLTQTNAGYPWMFFYGDV
jgi:hypothetical protein